MTQTEAVPDRPFSSSRMLWNSAAACSSVGPGLAMFDNALRAQLVARTEHDVRTRLEEP